MMAFCTVCYLGHYDVSIVENTHGNIVRAKRDHTRYDIPPVRAVILGVDAFRDYLQNNTQVMEAMPAIGKLASTLVLLFCLVVNSRCLDFFQLPTSLPETV